MSNKETVLNLLTKSGPLSRDEISRETGLGVQQTNNTLHGLKVDGLAIKNPSNNLWSTLGQAVPVLTAREGVKLDIGDLLEVAGKLHDGTMIVRTLEEQTVYSIYEL